MQIPSFVIKFQDYLLSNPRGTETRVGRIWVFSNETCEITISEFEGADSMKYILVVFEDLNSEDSDEYEVESEAEVSHLLKHFLGLEEQNPVEDLAQLLPDLDVEYNEADDDWNISITNSECFFVAKKTTKGWSIVFVGEDENEQGGPFPSLNDLKRFVYSIVATMRPLQQDKPQVPNKAKQEQVSTPNKGQHLRSAAEKIADACDDLDLAGSTEITEVLVLALKAIQKTIQGEKE